MSPTEPYPISPHAPRSAPTSPTAAFGSPRQGFSVMFPSARTGVSSASSSTGSAVTSIMSCRLHLPEPAEFGLACVSFRGLSVFGRVCGGLPVHEARHPSLSVCGAHYMQAGDVTKHCFVLSVVRVLALQRYSWQRDNMYAYIYICTYATCLFVYYTSVHRFA